MGDDRDPAGRDEDKSPWRQYRLLVITELERLGKEIAKVNDKLDGYGARVAALEDRTAGQRTRLEAAERGYGTVSQAIGRIEDRQSDRNERITELERQTREKPQGTSTSWTDIPLKILIGAILVGMALGKAGFDPAAWLK